MIPEFPSFNFPFETFAAYDPPIRQQIVDAVVQSAYFFVGCSIGAEKGLSVVPWDDLDDLQQDALRAAVRFALEEPEWNARKAHEHTLLVRSNLGFVHGEFYDHEKKTDPLLAPFEELPIEHINRTVLFRTCALQHAMQLERGMRPACNLREQSHDVGGIMAVRVCIGKERALIIENADAFGEGHLIINLDRNGFISWVGHQAKYDGAEAPPCSSESSP